jgi:integral membrane protein
MASNMISSPLGRFRLISFSEGVSFVLLLGIAMPLKYVWQIPEAVKIAGYLHGGLFILYCVLLLMVTIEMKWSFKTALLLFLASIFPFGFLIAEKKFLKKQANISAA